jgi:hypothetical protein
VSAAQIDLLNESAPSFFWLLQRNLWDSVVLSIARLTGSPRSMGQDNLALRRLPSAIGDVDLKRKVDDFIRDAQPGWDAFTQWRHKHLAHRDLKLAIGRGAEPLPPQTAADIEVALSAIRDVLNAIEGKYFDADVAYELPSRGDAEALLYLVRKGQEADNAEIAEILK